MILPTFLPPARHDAHVRGGEWRGQLLQGYLRDAAARDPDRRAVTDGLRSWTYGEIDQLIDDIAAGLRACGIGAGDVVAWQLPNWAEALAIHHAAIRIGAISNPIIPIYREREVTFILRQARARILFTPRTFRGFDHLGMVESLRSQLPDLQHVVLLRADASEARATTFERFCSIERSDASAGSDAAVSADDIALLLYTSGTTADPKGVLHTHNTLDYENRSIIALYGLGGDDIVFMPSPIAHITGILYALHLPFMLGSEVVLQDVWNQDAALRLIAQHRCSVMIAATPFLHGIVYHPALKSFDVSSLRVFACGGADVPPELISEAERSLDCLATRIYGSSEFPTLSSCSADDPPQRRATTDGRPIASAEARVIDPDETGAGELEVRGPELFVGYLDEGLNAAAFDEEGWFRTGDLATLDPDGYVTITGRLKDIIIRGGENISAKEVEDLLFEHPAVRDVAIVSMPDPVLVERSCAYVVPRGEAVPSLRDLTDFLEARRLTRQKFPERLEIVAELPRTASGKVQKFKLRDEVRKKLEEARGEPERAD